MNERALAYIASIKKQVSEQPAVTRKTTIIPRVLELGKTLTILSRPGAVGDPVARTDMRERALHLAVGIIVGPVEEREQSERVLAAIQPEVAGRVREYLIVTAGSLEKERVSQP
ncbi:MAG: hypothetical protein H0W89_03465 [Candidatus Levybacteria bacterium]|nr:hypothetical protein [Candidatus Levybacteria bacterium]